MTDRGPVLSMRGVTKSFGDKVALEHVDLDVARGEVHAVCGENGAGKSTLMNVLAGIHQPDGGRITLQGRDTAFGDASSSASSGIGMVHQHFTLVPSMTVAENIFLGRQPRRWRFLTDSAAMVEQAQAVLDAHHFELDARARVRDLTVGQRQRVEIAKALARRVDVLILDEPTAVLTPPEVDDLMDVVADLRARSTTVLFITHKLREVMAVSDRVTVIRRGRSIWTKPTSEVDEPQIATAMVGRSTFLVERRAAGASARTAAPVLRCTGVSARTSAGADAVRDVTVSVAGGEVLGIAGVEGNGQTELAELLTGLRRPSSGQVQLDGTDVTSSSSTALRRAGVAHIPEDRLDRGLSPTMSVGENLALSNYRSAGLARAGVVSSKALQRWSQSWIDRFDVRGAQPGTKVGELSGGNMQKIVVARELAREPRLLVVAQPTRGVDIGASEFVHHQLLEAAARGCAVVLFSSELSEVLALSDRIGVMYRGRLVTVMDRSEASEERLGLVMNTGRAEAVA